MPKDTFRYLVRESLMEILEEDGELLQEFLELARIEIVRAVAADIRKMIQRRAPRAAAPPRRMQPPMSEDDGGGDGGDGGDDGGDYGDSDYGDSDYGAFFGAMDGGGYYDDYGMGGGGGGYGGGYGNPAANVAARKGAARFFEGQTYGLLGEGFDPESADQAFGSAVNQAKMAASQTRGFIDPNEFRTQQQQQAPRPRPADMVGPADRQLDEMLGTEPPAPPVPTQAPRPQQGIQGQQQLTPEAIMESMAMDAVMGDDFLPQPPARQGPMQMGGHYANILNQTSPGGPRARLDAMASGQAMMHMSNDPLLNKANLDKPVGELAPVLGRARSEAAPLAFHGNPEAVGEDGKPLLSPDDPEFNGERKGR